MEPFIQSLGKLDGPLIGKRCERVQTEAVIMPLEMDRAAQAVPRLFQFTRAECRPILAELKLPCLNVHGMYESLASGPAKLRVAV